MPKPRSLYYKVVRPIIGRLFSCVAAVDFVADRGPGLEYFTDRWTAARPELAALDCHPLVFRTFEPAQNFVFSMASAGTWQVWKVTVRGVFRARHLPPPLDLMSASASTTAGLVALIRELSPDEREKSRRHMARWPRHTVMVREVKLVERLDLEVRRLPEVRHA